MHFLQTATRGHRTLHKCGCFVRSMQNRHTSPQEHNAEEGWFSERPCQSRSLKRTDIAFAVQNTEPSWPLPFARSSLVSCHALKALQTKTTDNSAGAVIHQFYLHAKFKRRSTGKGHPEEQGSSASVRNGEKNTMRRGKCETQMETHT